MKILKQNDYYESQNIFNNFPPHNLHILPLMLIIVRLTYKLIQHGGCQNC